MRFLFSCTLRRRLFLGKKWAAKTKRTWPLSERSLLYRRGVDILKQREMVLPKRTNELRPSLVSAKRPSSEDSLEIEEGCSKRHWKDDPAKIINKYHTGVGMSKKKKKERSITRVSQELRKKYHLTIDGELFDVPPLVETSYGSLQAFDFTEDPKEEMQIRSGVKDLLVEYNVSKATDYELADILMTNSAVVRGMVYYVTFTGISVTTRHLKTFQAKLWVDFTDKMHLLYCREKP